MINNNKCHLICFLLINSISQLNKRDSRLGIKGWFVSVKPEVAVPSPSRIRCVSIPIPWPMGNPGETYENLILASALGLCHSLLQ